MNFPSPALAAHALDPGGAGRSPTDVCVGGPRENHVDSVLRTTP